MGAGTTHYLNMSDQLQKQDFLRKVGALKGLWEIILKERKHIRSIPQNAWYWSCIVPALQEALKEQGELVTGEGAHEIMKSRFLKTETRIVNEITGEEEQQLHVRSTAELNTKEFAEYCDHCIRFIAEWFNVTVLNPNEPFV